MRTPRPYKVKLNNITLYDCETLESAQEMIIYIVQGKVNPALAFYYDDEMPKLAKAKTFTLKITEASATISKHYLGRFTGHLNKALNDYQAFISKGV